MNTCYCLVSDTVDDYYIRQVNGVKLADIWPMFSPLCVCVSVCVHVAAVFHTQYINANCSNTDFKFHKHVHRDSPDMTPEKIFRKWGVARVT